MNARTGPLSHVKVLDLSRILAAPWAGQILADLGAEVIGVSADSVAAQKAFHEKHHLNFPLFADADGKMNRSVVESGGAVLVVSQFTLAASTRRGRRPSFDAAAPPERALQLYERYAARLRTRGPCQPGPSRT